MFKFYFKHFLKKRILLKSLFELMGAPWPRIKEYMNILASLQVHTPKSHPDQENIEFVLDKIRELNLYIKQV